MKAFAPRLVAVLAFAVGTAPVAGQAEAQGSPAVGGYTVVSTTRVTRTISSFTYRAQLTNTLPDSLTGVRATLTSRSPATVVVDGSLGFGDVGAGATVSSQDTFTIRQDRTVPFDPADLVWSVGVRLAGAPATFARHATIDLPPVGVDASETKGSVILTRLDAFLAEDATVAQVNAALDAIGATIVSMLADVEVVTVAVPIQTGIEGLQALAQTLMGFPGIQFAMAGVQTGANHLAPANDVSAARHLIPTRFPAAWNAASLLANCSRVPLVIQDEFRAKPAGFDQLFPGFPTPAPAVPTGDATQDEHGYHMIAVAAAPLSSAKSPGTNPFINCLDLRPIQKSAVTLVQELGQLLLGFPSSGKFAVSYSLSFPSHCKAVDPLTNETLLIDCSPTEVANDILPPLARAYVTWAWKLMSRSRWPDFLAAVSASNERNDGLGGAGIYPGLGRAANASAMAVAAAPDPLFNFVEDANQWTPNAAFLAASFPDLVAPAPQVATVRGYVRAVGLDTVTADNVVVVGGLTTIVGDPKLLSPGHDDLSEAAFSNSGPGVKTVAVDVAGVCASLPCPAGSGNSRAAPQVAGLATYLWALSADLRSQPASITRRAIVDNARNDGQTPGILDAYATVLSLDEGAAPNPNNAPVRKAILDVNTGGLSTGRFDEADIAEFLSNFFEKDANGNFILDAGGNPIDPSEARFDRYDLNGDGFTGGAGTERFDLDRVGSTRFGQTDYSTVTQSVEGVLLEFDELAVTDLQVLCYYAYSDLYEGDRDVRRNLLSRLPGGRQCAFSISPPIATLAAGDTQQFTASIPVTWTATSGTIDPSTGLFTAGQTAGTAIVRATSGPAFAEATVTITAAPPPAVPLLGGYDGTQTIESLTCPGCTIDSRVRRWLLVGTVEANRFVLTDNFLFCGSTNCTPEFSITNGQFHAQSQLTDSFGGVTTRTVSGSIAGGRLRFVYELRAVDSSGQLLGISARTTFDGTHLIVRVTPASLDFGTVAAGGTSTRQLVTIRNTGLLPVGIVVFLTAPIGSFPNAFTLLDDTCFANSPFSGPGFFFLPSSAHFGLAEGSACTIAVQFTPPSQQLHPLMLTVGTDFGAGAVTGGLLSGGSTIPLTGVGN